MRIFCLKLARHTHNPAQRPAIRRFSALLAASVFSLSTVLASAPAMTQSQHSCFNARNCISVSTDWSTREHGRLNVRVQNTCGQGVSVRMCGQRSGQSELCLFEWIRGSGNWNTYFYNSTGNVAWRHVGSARSGEAWYCAGLVSDWHSPMRYH